MKLLRPKILACPVSIKKRIKTNLDRKRIPHCNFYILARSHKFGRQAHGIMDDYEDAGGSYYNECEEDYYDNGDEEDTTDDSSEEQDD